jgi:hypothetical protein
MLVALLGGAVLLIPALVYLYVLFQRSPVDRDADAPTDSPEAVVRDPSGRASTA